MDQQYYDKLANFLLSAIQEKELGDILSARFVKFREILIGNYSTDEKNKIAIEAEYYLSLTEKFPAKVSEVAKAKSSGRK